MELNDRYAGYEHYIEETVNSLNECSTVVNSLQKSTYNPEVVALTYSIQVLIELVADTAALSLNNNINTREQDEQITQIIEYLR
jgi:uncharacterized protein YutE (UPF0331/DUF86 family)